MGIKVAVSRSDERRLDLALNFLRSRPISTYSVNLPYISISRQTVIDKQKEEEDGSKRNQLALNHVSRHQPASRLESEGNHTVEYSST